MTETLTCPRCGGDRLHEGTIQSTGLVRFRPSAAKFLTLKTADIAITALMCLDCGAINLFGDVAKAQAVVE